MIKSNKKVLSSMSSSATSNKKFPPNCLCPCGSNKKYKKCCKVYHDGIKPSKAVDLMKSRYTAYAICNSDYIVQTTHENNSDYTHDINTWKQSIEDFSKYSEFRSLEILDFIDGDSEAFVTFKANIFQDNKDVSFTEKSRFLKKNDKWYYVDGTFL